MTSRFDDILAAICSEVKLLNENETQISFSLTTAKEAQLAYDVLAAYGFDVRIYHENTLSKLYINHSASMALSEKRLVDALSHAQTLRNILNTVEDDSHISFTNTPDMGKQISIYFPSQEKQLPVSPVDDFRAAPPRSRSAPYSPMGLEHSNRRIRKKSALLAEGPVVAKKTIVPHSGFRGWLHNYFVSHFAENFLAFCTMIFFAIFTLSVVVTSKGYFCPDLAVVKSKAWYCNFTLSDLAQKKNDQQQQQQP